MLCRLGLAQSPHKQLALTEPAIQPMMSDSLAPHSEAPVAAAAPSHPQPQGTQAVGGRLGFERRTHLTLVNVIRRAHFTCFRAHSSRFNHITAIAAPGLPCPPAPSPVAGPGDCFFALPCRALNNLQRVPLATCKHPALDSRFSILHSPILYPRSSRS